MSIESFAPRSIWQLAERHRRSGSTPRPPRHKPQLKDHFPELVAYVYLARYVTPEHVFLRHRDIIATYRTCNRHLQQLVHLKYLTCDTRHHDSDPNMPFVYSITAQGKSYLTRQFGWRLPPGRDERLTPSSLLHELMITAFDLDCYQAIKQRDDLHFVGLQLDQTMAYRGVLERRYHLQSHRLTFSQHGTLKPIEPDGGFMLGQERDDPTPHFVLTFLEIDNGTMSPKVIAKKLRTYADWFESTEGRLHIKEQYDRWGRPEARSTFRLLMVLRTTDRYASPDSRLGHIYTEALALPDYLRDALWLTTVDAITQHSNALAAPIWTRGRSAKDWLRDYQTFAAHLPKGRGRGTIEKRRKYVADKLAATPKTCLLPQPFQGRGK